MPVERTTRTLPGNIEERLRRLEEQIASLNGELFTDSAGGGGGNGGGFSGDGGGIIAGGGSDAMVPTVGMHANAEGLITYSFDGTVFARALAFLIGTKSTANTIRWLLSEEGAEAIGISGTTSGGEPNRFLTLEVIGTLATALLDLTSRNKLEGEGAIAARLRSVIGGKTVTIWDELERSGFLQIGSGAGVVKRRVNSGTTECEFTVKGNATATKTVAHGLGVPATGIWGTVPLTSSCFVEAEPNGTENINLRARYPFGELAAGTKVTVRWLAIG